MDLQQPHPEPPHVPPCDSRPAKKGEFCTTLRSDGSFVGSRLRRNEVRPTSRGWKATARTPGAILRRSGHRMAISHPRSIKPTRASRPGTELWAREVRFGGVGAESQADDGTGSGIATLQPCRRRGLPVARPHAAKWLRVVLTQVEPMTVCQIPNSAKRGSHRSEHELIASQHIRSRRLARE